MPGYADWKTLYALEHQTLYEEGYPLEKNPKPAQEDPNLPFPESERKAIKTDSIHEAQWEQAYLNLWKVRSQPLRPGYTYEEPHDLETIFAQASSSPKLLPSSGTEYVERIRGAWAGRISGVVLGKPLEMGWSREKIREYLESVQAYPLSDYVPEYSKALDIRTRGDCLPSNRGHVAYCQPDDDIHYTILALLLAERNGPKFNFAAVGNNWLDNIPYHWFWCASRQAYYHMVNLRADRSAEEQIKEFPWKLNPWRECIDGQLRGDFWGYIKPADPRAAAALAYQDSAFNLTKNGLYGSLFVAACVSAALAEKPDVNHILDAGLSVIPAKSRLAETVQDVRHWYAETPNWEKVCEKIEKKWATQPFWGTLNNMAIVALSLLHGNLDHFKTVTTACMCGIDTDCNSATAGSIAGAACGYSALRPELVLPLNDTVKTVIAGYGQGSMTDLVKRTLAVHEKFASR
jgi:hypothetical protein